MTDLRVATLRKQRSLKRRKQRVRKKLYGSAECPRLTVFRSNRHVYAQIVDDIGRATIVGCSTLTPALKEKCAAVSGKLAEATVVGEHIALLAKEKGVDRVQFDRNGRRYHGRVKAVADGARSGGLQF